MSSEQMNVEIHNPHGKPAEELPRVYGFNNGGSHQWYYASNDYVRAKGGPLP